MHDYKDVKKTVLNNLKPTKDYNPAEVLLEVGKRDREWTSQKWAGYLKKLNKRHKEKYDFSNSKWSWGQKNIIYLCPEHGERTGDLYNLLKGHGCSLCAGVEKTIEMVVERSRQRFGNQFNFSNSIFKGMAVEMEIICKTHGSMHITPEKHFWLSKGCRECGGKSEDFSSQNFLKKAQSKFGNRFDYSELGYKSAAHKVKIRCIRHDLIFETLPSDHTKYETGACPKCFRENISKKKSKPITVEGVEYPSITAAAQRYGIKMPTALRRIKKMGWDVDRAFTTPKK